MKQTKDENQYHFNLSGSDTGVTIRTGEALTPRAPETIQINGNIKAPENFWLKRSVDFHSNKCHVLINDQTIHLVLNEDDPYHKGFVNGSLKLDDETGRWSINSEVVYSSSDLARLVKANQFLFAKNEEWQALYVALNRFEANISVNLKDHKSTQGDMEKSIKITLSKQVPDSVTLNTRIFTEKREKYIIDIGAEVVGNQVKFYLDSAQLALRIQELREELIKEHSKVFEKELVIINA